MIKFDQVNPINLALEYSCDLFHPLFDVVRHCLGRLIRFARGQRSNQFFMAIWQVLSSKPPAYLT